MTTYGVITDYDYSSTHKRERLTLWTGPFASVYEAEALSLPNGAGYMLTTYGGDKLRVACPAPRTDQNYTAVDQAISEALTAHYAEREAQTVRERLEYLRTCIEAEDMSYSDIAELQNLAYAIDEGDTQLLEWAGVPEHPEQAS